MTADRWSDMSSSGDVLGDLGWIHRSYPRSSVVHAGACAVLVILTTALLRANGMCDVLMLSSSSTTCVVVGVLAMGSITTSSVYLVISTSILMVGL